MQILKDKQLKRKGKIMLTTQKTLTNELRALEELIEIRREETEKFYDSQAEARAEEHSHYPGDLCSRCETEWLHLFDLNLTSYYKELDRLRLEAYHIRVAFQEVK